MASDATGVHLCSHVAMWYHMRAHFVQWWRPRSNVLALLKPAVMRNLKGSGAVSCRYKPVEGVLQFQANVSDPRTDSGPFQRGTLASLYKADYLVVPTTVRVLNMGAIFIDAHGKPSPFSA